MQNNDLAIMQTNNNVYCSVKPTTLEDKKKLYNAIENCDVVLNDIEGTTIEVKDVFIQEYPRKDKDTGEPISNGHRTILFDTQGKTYVTASNYFFVSIAKILNSFGTPDTWEQPLKITITKRMLKTGTKCLSLKLV